MEINKILTADILDIIFDGRNKDYGAYDLRKTYNKRIRTSLLVMGGLVAALVAGYFINNYQGTGKRSRTWWCRTFSWKILKKKKRTNHRHRHLRRKSHQKWKWPSLHLPRL